MKEVILFLKIVDEDLHKIYSADIDTNIIINNATKHVENTKEFFRNIIFNMFIENEKHEIKLCTELKKYENKEVLYILEEMIDICNNVDIEVEIEDE
ncbi:MAG: hypothetical protein AB1Z23_01890 [Eubacteriales bacterium]